VHLPKISGYCVESQEETQYNLSILVYKPDNIYFFEFFYIIKNKLPVEHFSQFLKEFGHFKQFDT